MLRRALPFLTVLLPLVLSAAITVPAGLDHQRWEQLLQRYVDDRGLVDYQGWTNQSEDVRLLDAYLAAFARAGAEAAAGDEAIAALINAYNACTIRWIIQNHPTPSIRRTDAAWTKARWNFGGQLISLDDIEHRELRPRFGWKVHATIVCAARSCPPLQRSAYTAENLAALTAQAWRAWLARTDLNRFNPAASAVEVSMIFKWFKEDFVGDGALAKVLEEFGPREHRAFFAAGKFRIDYLDYHWGLNDQDGLGADYRHGWF